MIDRREFVTATLVLTTVGALSKPLLASPAATNTNVPTPELFIFDRRFAQAQQLANNLANNMATAGIALTAIEGDFTALWSSTLRPLWKQRPMAVAGLTTERSLFILQTLAGDHRMKLLHSQQLVPIAGAEPLYQWLIVPRVSA